MNPQDVSTSDLTSTPPGKSFDYFDIIGALAVTGASLLVAFAVLLVSGLSPEHAMNAAALVDPIIVVAVMVMIVQAIYVLRTVFRRPRGVRALILCLQFAPWACVAVMVLH